MERNVETCLKSMGEELISFTQEAVRIKSISDQEGELAHYIEARMKQLGYDEVFIDSTGNVVGRIGKEGKVILFDSHMDTVEVNDEADWIVPPFSGQIVGNCLYGRGAVDMKSSIAASVYGAVIARDMGYTKGKTVYVTCSVDEEYCDGENLKHLFEEKKLRPDFVVICEPSDNMVSLGHKGKAQIVIRTEGVSAHGSAPEKGVNAVYEMAEIISRVEKKNLELMASGPSHGTLVLSEISCTTASLNAVPSECMIYLDRRMVLGETEQTIRDEMNEIIRGKHAVWEIGTLHRTSWTGVPLDYNPMHPAWKIEKEHPLTQACNRAYEKIYGAVPETYDYWDYSTNGVTPVSMGIPTIGFGPGVNKLAHMVNEHCEVSKIKEACGFYAELIGEI